MAIDTEMRKRIDRWIRDKELNPFGDPPDTVYAGGNPLFNMLTGLKRDRYEYILDRHPELRKKH